MAEPNDRVVAVVPHVRCTLPPRIGSRTQELTVLLSKPVRDQLSDSVFLIRLGGRPISNRSRSTNMPLNMKFTTGWQTQLAFAVLQTETAVSMFLKRVLRDLGRLLLFSCLLGAVAITGIKYFAVSASRPTRSCCATLIRVAPSRYDRPGAQPEYRLQDLSLITAQPVHWAVTRDIQNPHGRSTPPRAPKHPAGSDSWPVTTQAPRPVRSVADDLLRSSYSLSAQMITQYDRPGSMQARARRSPAHHFIDGARTGAPPDDKERTYPSRRSTASVNACGSSTCG